MTRPFPTSKLDHLDPFLLLDHMGPVDWGPGEAIGAPDHPHRGFETVTYLLEGRMEHEDSAGHVARLGPGDVQWMTAGAGVVHSEMPEAEFRRTGGRVEGFQLWVNLPAADKMIAPRYQELSTRATQSEDGSVLVKIIAGKALGAETHIETRTPIFYFHVILTPGATFEQPVTEGHNVFAYTFRGTVTSEDDAGVATTAAAGETSIFEPRGGGVRLLNRTGEETELLLIGGAPLNEPVARYGPFVMNTTRELQQAFADYQSGAFGRIPRAK